MSQFMKGIKQTVAKDKIMHGKSLEKGEKPMNFSTYKLMCKKFFKSNHEYADFAHLYLIDPNTDQKGRSTFSSRDHILCYV